MIYPYKVISENMAFAMRVLYEKDYTVSGACAEAWNYEFENMKGNDALVVVEWPCISFKENIRYPSIPYGWILDEDDSA